MRRCIRNRYRTKELPDITIVSNCSKNALNSCSSGNLHSQPFVFHCQPFHGFSMFNGDNWNKTVGEEMDNKRTRKQKQKNGPVEDHAIGVNFGACPVRGCPGGKSVKIHRFGGVFMEGNRGWQIWEIWPTGSRAPGAQREGSRTLPARGRKREETKQNIKKNEKVSSTGRNTTTHGLHQGVETEEQQHNGNVVNENTKTPRAFPTRTEYIYIYIYIYIWGSTSPRTRKPLRRS